MAKLNRAVPSVKTHEGAVAKHITPEQMLRRSVLSCLLWEKEFYEGGVTIANRIGDLVPKVDPMIVADLAILARTEMNLRHVPLLLVNNMLKHEDHRKYVREVIAKVVNRPDEMGELLAMYFGGGAKNRPLASSLKKGLADAFCKFNEYQLAKYNRDEAIKLRDVLFLTHAKPVDDAQALLWKKLIGGFCENCGQSHYNKDTQQIDQSTETCSCYKEMRLTTPDTWEVALSSGGDKREHWERLLREGKLGALALLRNLRNMQSVGVTKEQIAAAFDKTDLSKVLPYRYIAAARYAPNLENILEKGMFKSLKDAPMMEGRTVLLIDVSGSMDWKLSDKSDLNRIDAACGLAMLVREVCKDVEVFTFSTKLVHVPPRRGFALRDAIVGSQHHSSTYLGKSLTELHQKVKYDRLIVITDEQSHDKVMDPKGTGYMINVASNKYGVGYGAWNHIDGFSEAVVKWIQELENDKN